MTIDQLILWLSKLGFEKSLSIPPLEGDYYMVSTVFDGGFQEEITIVDVYFDEFGSYKDGSIGFSALQDEVIKSQFWAGQREHTEDLYAVEKFESINDLSWHINQFKVSYENLKRSSHA